MLLDGLEEKAPQLTESICKVDVIVSRSLSKKQIEKIIGTKKRVASPAEDADIKLVHNGEPLALDPTANKQTAVFIEVNSEKDEKKVADAFVQGASYVIVRCTDWKIIPLENIISRTRLKGKVLMEVADYGQARVALETLELGSDGVVLHSSQENDILKTKEILHGESSKLELVEVEVIAKKELGLGARACVDTVDLMTPGEGLLVGCQSSALFLIQAEAEENPYIASRPIRVNAGPVSLYVLSGEDKTNYLSELEAGHPLLLVNRDGKTRPSCVARIKIEKRPMILLEAQWKGKKIKTILQNAETIRLVTKEGSISIAELKPGDSVLAKVESGGRHFGALVSEESIVEK